MRTLQERVSQFKADLLTLSDKQMIHKYYLSGSAHALEDHLHYEIREEVADHFNVNFEEVFLVGSAKLGFSIKPRRRYGGFNYRSDIDIVIVSSKLFNSIWEEVFDFERNGGTWEKADSFKEYHFKGWIRPDKLPLEPAFASARTWWDFFERLSGSEKYGPYHVRGGLYQSRFFFDRYQQQSFGLCRNILTNENLSNQSQA